MKRITAIVDDMNVCGEAPVWDAAHQKLYWSDCGALGFYSYDWNTQTRTTLSRNIEINGVALNEAGGFIITNNSGIWRWDGVGDPTIIATHGDGAACRLNDCIADPLGRILAGSWFYDPEEDYEKGKLFSMDLDGTVRVLDDGFHLANGFGFSPDGRTLYFTDSVLRTIYAYNYDVQSGSIKNRRVFVEVDHTGGIPDGLSVDAEGYIWSAEWYGSCITRYSPTGKLDRRIMTPAKQTSSLIFGGPSLTDIFITSAAKSEVMPVMPPYYDPQQGYFGGALFHVNVGIVGKSDYRANIRKAGA